MTMSSDEFSDVLCEKMEVLRPHSFFATQQSKFFEECKESLKPGEVVVSADFSENYAFVVQDAAQGFHWNNSQCTIHPFVIYFRSSSSVVHLSFLAISDCLQHDTIAVDLFQKRLITFLKTKLDFVPEKILYLSDGAASQYKNRKNFLNLCCHYSDFRIQPEWHFSATSHGKDACDGLGGTVKRLAARASLQRPRPYEDQILTPFQLYEWAAKTIVSVSFVFCSTAEYENEKAFLETRFLKSKTITGTRSLHAFIPKSEEVVTTKKFSSSNNCKDERVTRHGEELEIEKVSGYVTCAHEKHWWLGCVLEKDLENAVLRLNLLHPHGPDQTFRYPATLNIITVPMSSILTILNPRTTTGSIYSILKKEKYSSYSKTQSKTIKYY